MSPLFRLPFCAALASAWLSLPALAQEEGAPAGAPPGYQSTSNLSSIPDPSTVFGAGPGAFLGVAFAKDNGDLYLKTVINTDLSLGPVGLGLALPVSILAYNDDQTGCAQPPCSRDAKAYGGFLRKHDWDDPSDWLRFLRYVRYGYKRDTVYFLIGQHWGSSIGHGTLVNRYNNALNLDLNKVGVAFDVNLKYGGFETLTDNVFDPNLLAGRIYVRPFGDTPILRGWAIGASVAADLNAPRNMATVLGSNGSTQLAVDDKGHPIASFADTQLAGGIDTEYALLDNSLIRLVPFVDANRIAGAGNGLHLGVMAGINFPIPLFQLTLDARLEYRIMQAGYIPEYFDQTYDLGRVSYARATSTGVAYYPKATVARMLKADPTTGTQGYYGEVAFNFAGFVQIGGTLQDYQSDNGASLGLYATIPKIEFVKLQGYYLRKNFSALSDAFTLDNRSLLGGSIAYKIVGPLYFRAQFERTWVVNPNNTAVTASDNYGFGLAVFLPFGGNAPPAGPPPAP
jgi:hypothetical protein